MPPPTTSTSNGDRSSSARRSSPAARSGSPQPAVEGDFGRSDFKSGGEEGRRHPFVMTTAANPEGPSAPRRGRRKRRRAPLRPAAPCPRPRTHGGRSARRRTPPRTCPAKPTAVRPSARKEGLCGFGVSSGIEEPHVHRAPTETKKIGAKTSTTGFKAASISCRRFVGRGPTRRRRRRRSRRTRARAATAISRAKPTEEATRTPRTFACPTTRISRRPSGIRPRAPTQNPAARSEPPRCPLPPLPRLPRFATRRRGR